MSVTEALAKICSNELTPTSHSSFAAIIGERPSKGARSPTLWNKAFAAHGIDCIMVPLDVEAPKVPELFEVLESTDSFIGGAIAAPYKEDFWRLCGSNLTSEALNIGAINCLYRVESGALSGTNTDGEGAVASIKTLETQLGEMRVMLLGAGGTGKAVASYLVGELKSAEFLTVSSRSESAGRLAAKLGCKHIAWHDLAESLPDNNLLINCTSLGDQKNIDQSPLSLSDLSLLPREAKLFDVVYDPAETKLLRNGRDLGLEVKNGLDMNLEQAVIGFAYATGRLSDSWLMSTRQAMLRAI